MVPILLQIINHPQLKISLQLDEVKAVERQATWQGYISLKQIHDKIPTGKWLVDLLFSDAENISAWLLNILNAIYSKAIREDLDKQILESFITLVLSFKESLIDGGIDLSARSYQNIFKQMAASNKLPFAKLSRDGLQIMGFLETRNLDFKNVVLLSASDDHLPGTNRNASFIPYSIKKALALPTFQENDAIHAYHFYRLLQRAENISLIHANKIEGKNNTRSRFLEQIIYDWKKYEKINLLEKKIEIPLPETSHSTLITIDKSNPTIERVIQEFFNGRKS